MPTSSIDALRNIATQLRIDSVRSTSEAGSGHPTSCMSAADIVAALFFAEMRYDPQDPQNPDNDRFVLSKGHAAPILYAAWAEAGSVPARGAAEAPRGSTSDLEGHPTPRLPFVDVATGSLGQGICAAIGIALNARRIGSDYRTYVLLGDGEIGRRIGVGSRATSAPYYKLDNLCAIIDVNALGQSRPTQFGHDMDEIARALDAPSGGTAIVVDGHDIPALLARLDEARATKGRPTMILARTLKGKGVASVEGKDGWHGKALKKGEEADKRDRRAREADGAGRRRPRTSRGRARTGRPRAARRTTRRCRRARLQEGGHRRDARSLGHRARRRRRRRSARRRARRRREELDLQRQVREGRSPTASTRISSPSR